MLRKAVKGFSQCRIKSLITKLPTNFSRVITQPLDSDLASKYFKMLTKLGLIFYVVQTEKSVCKDIKSVVKNDSHQGKAPVTTILFSVSFFVTKSNKMRASLQTSRILNNIFHQNPN